MKKTIAGLASAAVAAGAYGETIDYDRVQPGTPPSGWIAGVTGPPMSH